MIGLFSSRNWSAFWPDGNLVSMLARFVAYIPRTFLWLYSRIESGRCSGVRFADTAATMTIFGMGLRTTQFKSACLITKHLES